MPIHLYDAYYLCARPRPGTGSYLLSTVIMSSIRILPYISVLPNIDFIVIGQLFDGLLSHSIIQFKLRVAEQTVVD